MAESSSQEVSGKRFTKGDWAAVAVLILLLLFLLRQSLFTDDILLSFDTRFSPPYSAKATPEVFKGRADMIHSDLPHWLMPERLVTTRMVDQGIPPFWTPYTLGGMPLLAGLAYPVCYPVIWVLNGVLGIDPRPSLAWQSLIHLLAAGLGMYLFLRVMALEKLACLLGAVALSASAWYVTHLYIPLFVNAAAWIPLMFWAGECMVRRGAFGRHGLLMTAIVATSALGGFPQITLIGLYGAGTWIFIRTLLRNARWKDRLKPVIAFSLASMIGFALSMVQTLPAMELKKLSMRDQDYPLEYYKQYALEAPSLVGQVIPGFFGHPVDPEGGGGYYGNKPGFLTFRIFLKEHVQNNFMENSLFIGVIPLLLVLAALGGFRQTPVKILVLLGLLSLLITMKTPLMDLAYYCLPGFRVGHSKRILVLYAFALAALAAFGLHRFLTLRDKKPSAILTLAVGGAGVAGLGVLTLGFTSLLEALGRCWADVPGEELNAVLHYLRKITWPAVFALLIFALSLLLGRRPALRRLAGLLLVGFTLFELAFFGARFITSQPGEEQYPSTKTTDFLAEKTRIDPPFRVITFGGASVLAPNLTSVHGIQCAGGISGLLHRRYAEYCHALDPSLVDLNDARWVMALEHAERMDSPMLDLLGVRYVAVNNEQDGRLLMEKGFSLAFRNDNEHIGLFENPEVLPRAFAVTSHRIMERSQILDFMNTEEFDPLRVVIVEDPLPQAFVPQPDPQGRIPRVEIESYSPLEVVMKAQMHEARGFLVLADTCYPGWQALVDNQRAPVFTADYTFRAVPLNEGNHTVRFHYQPTVHASVTIITITAMGGILIWVLCLLWNVKKSAIPLHSTRPSTSRP